MISAAALEQATWIALGIAAIGFLLYRARKIDREEILARGEFKRLDTYTPPEDAMLNRDYYMKVIRTQRGVYRVPRPIPPPHKVKQWSEFRDEEPDQG